MDHVDKIITGKHVVTLDEFNRVIPRGAIAVKDGVIVDVGTIDEIRTKYKSEEVIERKHHLITPGFIDCHTHTQQYLLRSAVNDEMLQLPPIWTKVLVPFERVMSEDLARISSQASIVNMLKNGVTYFIEAGAPYPEVLAETVIESGIKGAVSLATYNVLEGEVWDSTEVLKRIEALSRMYSGKAINLRVWMSIRQVMMATEDLIEAVIELAEKHDTGLTLHLAEYQGEVDYTLGKHGKRPLEYMLNKGLGNIKPVVIAHGVYLSPREVELVKKHDIGVCWCPTIDSWIMGVHWSSLVNAHDVKLGLGSDGGVWNKLDLLHEVKVAKAVGKAVANAIAYYKSGLDSQTLMNALTGARGLIVGERTGRIEKGYAADIVVLNTRSISALPVHNPVDLIVNYLEGETVTDVFINGKQVVENGYVLTLNEEKIVEKILDIEDEVKRLFIELKKNLRLTLDDYSH